MKNTTENFYTKVLKIAEKNLTTGNWTIETAQFFLKMADEQPQDVQKMFEN